MSQYLLTVCIATYNRAGFLNVTLKGLVEQVNRFGDVELLIADGNSTDNTAAVVANFQAYCPRLNYLRLKEKGGVDQDYDAAVRHASGEYCWLFTDDDLLKDDAIGQVRVLLTGHDTDLLVINAEVCDFDMREVIQARALPIYSAVETDFRGPNRDAFFRLCATYLTFIGAVVIRKSLWLSAPGPKFYGSRFIHVGVISTLGESSRVLLAPEPLIRIRLGNAEWSNISFKVWVHLWPALIWSIPDLSDDTKKHVCFCEPWTNTKLLLWHRATGAFSRSGYLELIQPKPHSLRKIIAYLIAITPRALPWLLYFLYATCTRDRMKLYCLGEGGKSKNTWLSKN